MSFRQTVYQWLQNGATASLTTASTYGRFIEPFVSWAETKGLAPGATKAEDLVEFMRHAKDCLGWSGGTLDTRMALIRRFYTWAVEQGLCKKNPAIAKNLPKIIIEKSERVPFTEEQYRRVLKMSQGAAPYWHPAIEIAWHTGQRCSDVCLLRWEQVSFDDGMIRFVPKKTKRLGKRLEVPLSDDLRHALLTLRTPGGVDADYVQPLLASRYLEERWPLLTEFRELCDSAGLPRHTFHGFRHGFVSRLLNQGVGHLIIASMTGHTLEQIETYAHVSTDAKRAALGIKPSFVFVEEVA